MSDVKTVRDSTAAKCRYGEFVEELYGDYEVVEDKSEYDYQGCVDIVAKNDAEYIYVEFAYGSCSGCDDWEYRNLSDDAIRAEIQSLTLHLSPSEYEEWKTRKHRTMRAW